MGRQPGRAVWAIGAQDASGSTVLVAKFDTRPRELALTVADATATVRIDALGFDRVVLR